MTRWQTAFGTVFILCAGIMANSGEAAGFRSPTGNIVCYLDIYSGQPYAEMPMVCLVFEADWDLPPDYGDDSATCDLDRTRTVILPPNGPASVRWTCHGDVFWPSPLGALGYGSDWSISQYNCSMATDGVRCASEAGYGFQVRRSGYRLE